MTEENLVLPAIELPHPHGFLVWRGKQKCLINKEPLPVGQEIAIVSDGEYFGTVILDEPVPVTDEYLNDEFESHRLKSYELPEEESVVQNIVSLEKMKDTVAARVDEGLLVIDELPELNETGLHLWNNAKDLPTTIILERGAIKVTEAGEVVGKAVDEKLLETLKRNYDMDLEHVEKAAASSALSLYDVTLTRTPNMRFKFIEPPNLRFTDEPDGAVRCKMCEHFKQGTCEAFGVTVDDNQVCDAFDPKYEGTAVMLPIPLDIAQRLVLTEKDVPMGSELIEADDLHITLYYEHELNLQHLMELPQILHMISQSFPRPTVQVQGIGKFELVENGTKDVIKLGVDSPEIKMMHTWLMSYLGIDSDTTLFSPHISLAYVPAGSAVPNVNYYRDMFTLDEIVMNIAGGCVFSAMFEDNSVLVEEEIMGKEAIKMPYEIVEQDGQYCVIKPETDEIEECYDTEEEAQALLTALQINVEDSKQKEGRRLQGKWLTTLSKLYEQLGELVSWAKREDEDEYKMHGFGIKETEQGPIFYTYSSNAFEDRDREIITTNALEEFVARNSENENKGYFNYWHVRSSDFAEKRWQGMIGRILVEAGPFLKNKKGRAAYKFFKKHTKKHPVFAQEGWGASIEFIYLPEQAPSGEYKWLHITRTSVLPLSKAANINTTSTIIGGNKMALTDQQIALGKEVFW